MSESSQRISLGQKTRSFLSHYALEWVVLLGSAGVVALTGGVIHWRQMRLEDAAYPVAGAAQAEIGAAPMQRGSITAAP